MPTKTLKMPKNDPRTEATAIAELRESLTSWSRELRTHLLETEPPTRDEGLRAALDHYTKTVRDSGFGSDVERSLRQELSRGVAGFDEAARGLWLHALTLKVGLLDAWGREHAATKRAKVGIHITVLPRRFHLVAALAGEGFSFERGDAAAAAGAAPSERAALQLTFLQAARKTQCKDLSGYAGSLLKKTDPALQRSAAAYLGTKGTSSDVKALYGCLAAKDAEVRCAAAEAMAEIWLREPSTQSKLRDKAYSVVDGNPLGKRIIVGGPSGAVDRILLWCAERIGLGAGMAMADIDCRTVDSGPAELAALIRADCPEPSVVVLHNTEALGDRLIDWVEILSKQLAEYAVIGSAAAPHEELKPLRKQFKDALIEVAPLEKRQDDVMFAMGNAAVEADCALFEKDALKAAIQIKWRGNEAQVRKAVRDADLASPQSIAAKHLRDAAADVDCMRLPRRQPASEAFRMKEP